MCRQTCLNLNFFLGIMVEVHGSRSFCGIVTITEIVNDYSVHTTRVESVDNDSPLGSPQALPVMPSPSRSVSSDNLTGSSPGRSPKRDEDDSMPNSPKSRSEWRLRQYQKLVKEKEDHKNKFEDKHSSPVLHIHLDGTSPAPPPIPIDRKIHRRKKSATKFSPTIRRVSSPIKRTTTMSSPSPPSMRRPGDAAPRRNRKSTGKSESNSPEEEDKEILQ